MKQFSSVKKLGRFHWRHWPFWGVYGLLISMSQLPYRMQMGLGRRLGRLLYYVLPKQRHIASVHFKRCFPRATEIERRRLLKDQFESLGQGIAELTWTGFSEKAAFDKLIHVVGQAHLDAALQSGQGVLLVSAHFHHLALMGRVVGDLVPFSAVMRPQRNALFNDRFEYHAKRCGVRIVHRHDVLSMRRCLSRGEVLLYLPDQDYGARHSMFVPFFEQPAATTTALTRLAKSSQALMVPVFSRRLGNNQGYEITFNAPLAHDSDQQTLATLTHINGMIEAAIQKSPEQYLWIYKRFRTRPAGENDFY